MPAKNLISFRKGTSNQWIGATTPLANGEPGYDTDTLRLKIGDGTTAWSGLNYVGLAGIGTSGYLSKFNSSQGVANSLIFDDGTRVGIGTTSPISRLQVSGLVTANSGNFTNSLTVNGDQNIIGSLSIDSIKIDDRSIRSYDDFLIDGECCDRQLTDLYINPDGTTTYIGPNPGWDSSTGGSGLWPAYLGLSPPDVDIGVVSTGIYTSKLMLGQYYNVDNGAIFPGAVIIDGNSIKIQGSSSETETFRAVSNSGVNIQGKTTIMDIPEDSINELPAVGASLGIGTSFPRGSLDILGDVYTDGEANINGNTNINGELRIANGVVYVYQTDSDYSSVLGPRGLKLFDNTIDVEVTQVDTNLGGYDFTPSGFLTANGFTVLGGSGPIIFNNLPEDNDIVLFSNFENPVNNGIYRLEQIPDSDPEYPQYKFKAIRATSYTNGSSIPNRYGVRVNDDNSRKFILNRYSNGNSIIGTDPLVFEYDSGDEVMTIQDSLDVDFVGAIAAKAKYFRIKHPDPNSPYSVLQYGSLESPYNGIRLTGKDKLNKGICEVRLPNYLKHLIHEEDISIQLTNKGHHKILYVDKIDLNNSAFTVKGYRSKTGGPFEFFWTFSGVRKDIDPLIVEH